ncbi:MAG: class I SAM-dependent methyltransferase [candidate division Zixibacteria bacterium]
MADVKKSWDKIASYYRKRYAISTEIVHYGPLCPGEDKLGLLGDIKGKDVIDLGCGCGQNAIALAKMGANVTGIDFSNGQIDEAKELASKHKQSIEFKTGDISDLSFIPDSKFDLAISACAIAYVEDIESTFKEAFRILRPGGIFILSDMNPLQYILDENDYGVEFNNKYPYKSILIKWGWEFDELKNSPRFQHFVRSIPTYINEITNAGFAVSQIHEPQSTLKTPHLGFSREIMDEYKYIAGHIPITFIIVCRKP